MRLLFVHSAEIRRFFICLVRIQSACYSAVISHLSNSRNYVIVITSRNQLEVSAFWVRFPWQVQRSILVSFHFAPEKKTNYR